MSKRKWIALGAVAVLSLVVGQVMANEKPTAALQDAMKSNGATLQKLGKDVDAKNFDAIGDDAAMFKKNFSGAVGGYFTTMKMDDALNKCKAAYGAANDLEKAAKAKDEMAVADARKALGGACGGCHMAHREKVADGFEVK
jgi:cytochrome c556